LSPTSRFRIGAVAVRGTRDWARGRRGIAEDDFVALEEDPLTDEEAFRVRYSVRSEVAQSRLHEPERLMTREWRDQQS
jgi:hypothetical protein